MKSVIDGKRYNTQVAEEIGSYSRGYPGDFDRIDETLYKTAKGSYFLAGEGGPRSKYSRSPRQNEWTGGEGITPLSEVEAREWCERHGVDADTIASHFTVEEA
jgi:hypothetical protein